MLINFGLDAVSALGSRNLLVMLVFLVGKELIDRQSCLFGCANLRLKA